MPRRGRKLSAAVVKTVTEPGKYYDVNGLFLRVLPSGTKQWVQRLVIHGKRRDLSLRTYPLVSLAEAREVAFDNRKLARAGGDPTALKRRPNVPTLEQAAETVIAIHAAGWRDGGKSEKQWRASLRDYAMPRLGHKRVDEVCSSDVLGVLVPIWSQKPETARRVRQRIGAIMKWAIAEGHRDDNPAGEAIAAALPRHNGAKTHHRALPHGEVGTALARVRASEAWPATKLAFEFLVLTACRSGEVRGARWGEIDVEGRVWTVPAERAKAGKPHRVPLSGAAMAVLGAAADLRQGDLVFPSPTGRSLSNATMSKLLRELGIEAVPHGMRASFRSWCAEAGVSREVAEASLGHVVQGVEGAYQRSDLLERRRELMEQWAGYVAGGGGRG